MYKLLLVCLILFGISLAACHRQSAVASMLSSADSLMDRRPDSSLAVLENIPPVLLTEKDEQAHYALLLTKARHKNYIDETDDSLINIALKYYRRHSSDSLLMQSLFYKATILYNSANYPKAIISATKAEDIARELNDNYWIARTCELIADIYSMTYYFDEDIIYRKSAAHYYNLSKRTTNNRYALLGLASGYCNNYDMDSALKLIDSLETEISTEPVDSGLLVECINTIIHLSLKNSDYANARTQLARLETLHDYYTPDAYYYVYKADIDLAFGNTDSIINFLRKAEELVTDISEKAAVRTSLIRYLEQKGRYHDALTQTDSILAMQNKSVYNMLKQSVIAAQRDAYNIQSAKEKLRGHQMKNLIIFTLITSLILITTTIYFYRMKIKVKNLEIDERMNDILILSNKIQLKEQENLRLTSTLADSINAEQRNHEHHENLRMILFREQWKTINTLCYDYFEKKDCEKTKQTIVADVEKEIRKLCDTKTIASIEQNLNQYFNNIIAKLRSQCPQLKYDDIKFMIFLYAGFAPRAICVFTGIKLKYYYNKRSRLIERISRSNAPDKDWSTKMTL